MIMAAIGNALSGDRLQGYLRPRAIEQVIRPLLATEQFTAGIRLSRHPQCRTSVFPHPQGAALMFGRSGGAG